MASPVILETIAALRAWRQERRAAGKRVGLVPTMGALHPGHLSLVTGVKHAVDEAVVSIFVNPTQFAPTEDFSKYPRTFENDIKLLRETGAEAVFAPQVTEIYPAGFATTVSLEGPAKVGLEDAFRPTHFAGVATVVTKLLLQCLPDVAIFGEKDYQQLCVVRRMARDLNIPVEIIGGHTVRTPSGLALSSRNAYMSEHEREVIAPMIHATLTGCAKDLRAGGAIGTALAKARRDLSAAGFAIDYIELRQADTLALPETDFCLPKEPYRLLFAGKLPNVRLIDNIAV